MVYALPPGTFADGWKLVGLVDFLIEAVGYWWKSLEKPTSIVELLDGHGRSLL